MKKNIWVLTALFALNSLPALAQGYSYHYSSGGSRVVNQNQTGLYAPSATYIGPGTMSKSAQGLPPGGAQGISNPSLPRVNMGANVRTPGDYLYYDPNAVPKAGQGGRGLQQGRMGANIGMPGDQMRSDLRYYVPGQNQRGSQGYTQTPQFIYRPGQGGTATYAEGGYNNNNDSGARRF